MKENYKLQITNIRGVVQAYFKLLIFNCQLSIVNEISGPGLLGIPNYNVRNYKKNTKGSHGLHKDTFRLQTMTALIKSFCGGPGGGFFKKSPLVAEGPSARGPY
jgi:hypothetical protein